MSRIRTGSAALLVLAHAIPAFAQTAPPDPAPVDAGTLPAIEVSSGRVPLLDRAPPAIGHGLAAPGQTATTIDASRFRDTPANSIGDILVQSPGVTVQQGNGPRDVSISVRGSNERQTFGVRNIVVFEDGFPVTQPDGLARTDLTDPHAYAGIDVVRGPSSAEYGNYATGGALDFHTRTGRQLQGAELGTDAGSFGYANTYASLGYAGPGWQASLFASNVRSDGFTANSRYDTATQNLLASYDLTPHDRVTLKIIDNTLDTRLPLRLSLNQFRANPFQKDCASAAVAGCATVGLFANGRNGATRSLTASQAGLGRHDRRTIAGLRWEHAFDADTVVRTQLVFDDRDIDQPTGSTTFVGDYPSFNLTSDLTHRGTIAGLPATTSIGANFNTLGFGYFVDNITPLGGATRGALVQSVSGHQRNAGGRARAEVALAPRLTGVLALGGEYTAIGATALLYAYPAAGGLARTRTPVARGFANVAPEASLLYAASPEWLLHTRVATGYGTPQAGNLFVTPQGTFGANTRLAAQTNLGVDAGATWTLGHAARVEATGFYEFFRNELVTQSAGVNLQSYTFNAPASEHRGIELGLTMNPLPRRLPGLYALGSYLYDNQVYTRYAERLTARAVSATFDRAGRAIPGVTPHNAFFRLGYDQPSGPLHGIGAFAETSVRGAYALDNANLIHAPAYALLNLEVHYDPGWKLGPVSALRAYVEVRNVLDATTVASASNITDTLSANGTQNGAAVLANSTGAIYAGEPRSIFAGVRIRM